MKPERKKNRLVGYNYSSPGYYYITICSQNREKIFWTEIGNSTSSESAHNDTATSCRGEHCSPALKNHCTKYNYTQMLSTVGITVKEAIEKIPLVYTNVRVVKYCIMPNHIHMVLKIVSEDENRKLSVSQIVKQLKGVVTKKVGNGITIWQKSYYDEILFDNREKYPVYRYIEENPYNYEDDKA